MSFTSLLSKLSIKISKNIYTCKVALKLNEKNSKFFCKKTYVLLTYCVVCLLLSKCSQINAISRENRQCDMDPIRKYLQLRQYTYRTQAYHYKSNGKPAGVFDNGEPGQSIPK